MGIGIVPYSPLGRGFFAEKAIVEGLHEGDSRLKKKNNNKCETTEAATGRGLDREFIGSYYVHV